MGGSDIIAGFGILITIIISLGASALGVFVLYMIIKTAVKKAINESLLVTRSSSEEAGLQVAPPVKESLDLCKNCGSELKGGSEFCSYCGMSREETSAEVEDDEEDEETTYCCGACGEELDDSDSFCPKCGEIVEDE
jgi:hypothetical protein